MNVTMWIEPSQAQEVLTGQKDSTRTLIHKLRERLSRSDAEVEARTDDDGSGGDIATEKENQNGDKTRRDGDAEGHLDPKTR